MFGSVLFRVMISSVLFSCMISSVLFLVMCIFFQLCTAFKLVPEIVQCCPPQSEVMRRLASDAVSTVSLQYIH
jgi:hypothetical protein